MRDSNGPVTDDVVRRYLPLDLALYAMWMPGDITTASIQSTGLDPVCTYDEIIERDEIHAACAEYLIRSGAPVFTTTRALDFYTTELEHQLRQGALPAMARDAALHVSRPVVPGK